MAEIKADLFGSYKTESLSDTAISRATRRWMVSDPDQEFFDNTNADYDRAINQVKWQHLGLHFPGDVGLPVEKITATRFGPHKMWVTVNYRYQPGSGFDPVNRMVAAYEPAYAHVPVYRRANRTSTAYIGLAWDWSDITTVPAPNSDSQAVNNTGLPWGDVMFEASGKPTFQMLPRPIVQVQVYTTLYFNPFGHPSYIGNYRDTVNSTTLVFGVAGGGQAYPELKGIFSAESLRFDGAWVQQRSDPGGILNVWDTRYQFSMMKGKWYKQVAFHSGTLGTLVQNEPMYMAVDFAGKFPVQAAPNWPG